MMTPREPSLYRPAAGTVVFNSEGKVFMGRRKNASGPYVWQFPQGGIDKGERPKQAALRELYEETGITAQKVEVIGRIKPWLYYDFPPGFKGAKRARGWYGQRQKWYALKFLGNETDINLKAHRPIEFTDWRWIDLAMAAKLVVPFKRPVYERIEHAFSNLL